MVKAHSNSCNGGKSPTMITRILKAPFKPFQALFADEPRDYPMRRESRKRYERSSEEKLSDSESEIFEQKLTEKVLKSDVDRGTLKLDVDRREEDLENLHIQIRTHWQKYQDWLEKARDKEGINKTKAKGKAKEAKSAAKDKEHLYKLLWKELDAMKDALRQDEQIEILSGGRYEVNFSDLTGSAVEKASQEYEKNMRKRKMTVQQFRESMDTMDDDVEIDFSDVDKDVAELEMEDAEDFGIIVEEPEGLEETVAETGEDWS